jgi:hypothetical protein
MVKFHLIGLFLFLLFTISCKKAKFENPLDTDLEFQFRLLNKKGQISTSFTQGENLRFSFLIINKSSRSWGLNQESLNLNDDFFRIYQDFGDKKTVGRPLVNPIFTEKIPFIPIIDTLKLEMDWIPNPNIDYRRFDNYHTNNLPLTSGKYRTGFTTIFSFYNALKDTTTYRTDSKSFNIDFEVK